MAEIHDHDDHHDELLNITSTNYTGINLNSPEWIAIRVALAMSTLIEVFVAAFIIDILHRKKLISESILRIIGSLTAGLMLSGGLVHIYAEAMEHYVETTEHPDYFLPFLIGAITILCLIVVDKAIKVAMDERKHYIERRTGRAMVEKNEIKEIELKTGGEENEPKGFNEENVPSAENEYTVQETDTNNIQGHGHFDIALGTDKWYVAILFLVAISLHSIFAGLGFGTTKSLNIMLQIYAFIILHKGLVAASLCVVMIKHKNVFTTTRFYLVVFTFALSTPIGSFIGIGISNINTEFELVEVVFNCISAGTFLYLSLRELTAMFFDEAERKWWVDVLKIIAFIIGFGFLTALAVWHPHEADSHDH
ncbi:Zinc transport protein [Oopsacas minuta]|uniref:Zinc transport protein n=1 Tax=Oopsacas minuta TaxID=111878 RepID=A0AAV7KB19_9METZ|nr:Zinc transport protein [Oopsacas minuta]